MQNVSNTLFYSIFFLGYCHSSCASCGWLSKEDTKTHLYLSIYNHFSWNSWPLIHTNKRNKIQFSWSSGVKYLQSIHLHEFQVSHLAMTMILLKLYMLYIMHFWSIVICYHICDNMHFYDCKGLSFCIKIWWDLQGVK